MGTRRHREYVLDVAAQYAPIFEACVLVVCVLFALYAIRLRSASGFSMPQSPAIEVAVVVALILFIGLRPLNGVFIDMLTYARAFLGVQSGNRVVDYGDPAFNALVELLAPRISLTAFFVVCAALYVVPLYLACRRWFSSLASAGFLMILGSFSFWSYGVNGIRNGIATSIFILAMSTRRPWLRYAFFALAVGFHLSMLIPLVAYILVTLIKPVSAFFVVWVLSIPFSLLAGSAFQTLFSGLDVGDSRLNYLTSAIDSSRFSASGFRLDFVLYSATAVVAGAYYVYGKKFELEDYRRLLGTYLTSNAMWILIIGSSYSNRFAYLSWFLIPVVLIFPLLRAEIVVQQRVKIAALLLANVAFTIGLTILL